MNAVVRSLSLALLLAGTAVAQGPGGAMPPKKVSYITVEKRDIPFSAESIGVTEPSRRVEVRARVEGFIDKRSYIEGTKVNQGDLLFEIDKRPFEANLDVSRARVLEAEARLKLAESELDRANELLKKQAIAQAEYDRRSADRDAAVATLKLWKAEVVKAELELEYTMVRSPLTGMVGKPKVEVGAYVDRGTNGLLTEVLQTDPMYATFKISEREFLDWKNDVASGAIALPEGGKPTVQLVLVDGTQYEHPGTLNFEDIKVDLQTGTMEIRGEFPNPDQKLKEGQFVRARLAGWSRTQVMAVPQRAIFQTGQGTFVYVVGAENKAGLKPVVTGQWSGNDWLIKSGLEPGDKVITDGLNMLMPGATVDPEPLGAAPAAPPANAAAQSSKTAK